MGSRSLPRSVTHSAFVLRLDGPGARRGRPLAATAGGEPAIAADSNAGNIERGLVSKYGGDDDFPEDGQEEEAEEGSDAEEAEQ
ncbi:hypothetical protein WJX72_003726 [[Myrmecia] bisecta]|uniref:Uncharacterized protein n=1 Tax=[Myrmecia] bisecta TaxID=41462 RepID=A0AAW1QEQ1_9CHLO